MKNTTRNTSTFGRFSNTMASRLRRQLALALNLGQSKRVALIRARLSDLNG